MLLLINPYNSLINGITAEYGHHKLFLGDEFYLWDSGDLSVKRIDTVGVKASLSSGVDIRNVEYTEDSTLVLSSYSEWFVGNLGSIYSSDDTIGCSWHTLYINGESCTFKVESKMCTEHDEHVSVTNLFLSNAKIYSLINDDIMRINPNINIAYYYKLGGYIVVRIRIWYAGSIKPDDLVSVILNTYGELIGVVPQKGEPTGVSDKVFISKFVSVYKDRY